MPLSDFMSHDDYVADRLRKVQLWRVWVASAFGVIIITLVYSATRIIKMDAWLHERTEYANTRDADWDRLFRRIGKELDRIEARREGR